MALVVGNKKSRIRLTIRKPNGTAWNLTGYAVTLLFQKPYLKAAVSLAATLEDAPNGIVYVDTDETTLDEPGDWRVQAELDNQVDAVTYSWPLVTFEVGQQLT